MFISDDLNITGLIDWRHSTSLPLFLQCSVSNSFQNNGDSVLDDLIPPKLQPNFDELSEQEHSEQISLLRKRQLHCFYVVGIGSDGRVSFEQYDWSMEIEEKLKQGAIKAAESEEERQAPCDHWVFGNFVESEHLYFLIGGVAVK